MRVSLPISTAGVSPRRPADSAASTRPAAYPKRSTSSGVIGGSPMRPRTPSVPKYFLLIGYDAAVQGSNLASLKCVAARNQSSLPLILVTERESMGSSCAQNGSPPSPSSRSRLLALHRAPELERVCRLADIVHAND